MKLPKDPELRQQPRVPLRHLPPEHRLHPRGIGFVLPPGEREHPGVPILDRHRSIKQRRRRIGQRKQVPRRHPTQSLRLGNPHIPLSQQRPQQHRQLIPRRAASKPQQRHPRLSNRLTNTHVPRHRSPHHQPSRLLPPQIPQRPRDQTGLLQPHPQHQRIRRQHRLVHGIMNHHPTDLHRPVSIPIHQLKQRGAQVIQHPPKTRPRPISHGTHHLPDPRSQLPTLVRPHQQFQPPLSSPRTTTDACPVSAHHPIPTTQATRNPLLNQPDPYPSTSQSRTRRPARALPVNQPEPYVGPARALPVDAARAPRFDPARPCAWSQPKPESPLNVHPGHRAQRQQHVDRVRRRPSGRPGMQGHDHAVRRRLRRPRRPVAPADPAEEDHHSPTSGPPVRRQPDCRPRRSPTRSFDQPSPATTARRPRIQSDLPTPFAGPAQTIRARGLRATCASIQDTADRVLTGQ